MDVGLLYHAERKNLQGKTNRITSPVFAARSRMTAGISMRIGYKGNCSDFRAQPA